MAATRSTVRGSFSSSRGSRHEDIRSRASCAVTSWSRTGRGPYITFDGSLTLSGLSLRISFSNQSSPDGVHNTSVTQDFSIIGSGSSFSFPKQPVDGGVGGNPWILAALTDGNGNELSDPVLLGRCVQLSQELGM